MNCQYILQKQDRETAAFVVVLVFRGWRIYIAKVWGDYAVKFLK